MRTATPLDQPRAIGKALVSSKAGVSGASIDGLRQSGALKVLFPRSKDRLDAILVNTAGGVTGGDTFDITATAGIGSHLTVTTQAAERVYRAQPGQVGRVRTRLKVKDGAALDWLPQETILFEDAALDRRLTAELAPDARFLMVEPLLFGRRAMGESPRRLSFRDRIDIRRGGTPLYRDGITLEGDVSALLDRPAIGCGARAAACVLWVAPGAAGALDHVRRLVETTGGASMLHADVMVLRLLAEDGFSLRQSLVPVLDLMTQDRLPPSWRL